MSKEKGESGTNSLLDQQIGLGLGLGIGLVVSVLFFLRNTPPPLEKKKGKIVKNKITLLEKIKPVSKK